MARTLEERKVCNLCQVRDAFKGDLLYVCGRCAKCYACLHKAIWNERLECWMWLCSTGRVLPVIRDGGVY